MQGAKKMTTFLVVIKGRNCLMARAERGIRRLIGPRTERLGFFATRYIEADNDTQAAIAAIDLIREELVATGSLKNLASDPPEFNIAEARQTAADLQHVAGAGFTFFKEPLH